MPLVLLIGEGDLAEETRQALDAAGAEVHRLKGAAEREVRHALEGSGIDRVVVVSRDDAAVLRAALMVRYVDGDVPMLVTIFDPTMAGQVATEIEHCEVTSMADIVGPSLAGPCLGEDLVAIREDADPPVGIKEAGDGVEEVPIEVPDRRRAAALVSAILMPYDKSAALLLWGALGLVVILLMETIAAMIVLDQGVIDATYGSAKTLVTVDPNDKVADGPQGLKAFITVSMLAALVFEASFTAGLVNRLIDRRLTGLFGRRAVPRRDHVVVVGMGQVGLRLCLLLRACGIGIVAVDDREEGENVGLAREMKFPVVIGRGADPSLLRRLVAAPGVRARRGDRRRSREHLDRDGRQVRERRPARGPAGRRRPGRERDPVAVPDRPRARRPPDRGGADRRPRDRVGGDARRLHRRRRAPAVRGRPARAGRDRRVELERQRARSGPRDGRPS